MPLYDHATTCPRTYKVPKNDGAEKKSQKGRKKIW